MAGFADYADYDALGLAELVRRQEVTPLELTQAGLDAIAALNPKLNALVMVLDGLSRDEVVNLEIGTGIPLVYRLNADTSVAEKQVLDG